MDNQRNITNSIKKVGANIINTSLNTPNSLSNKYSKSHVKSKYNYTNNNNLVGGITPVNLSTDFNLVSIIYKSKPNFNNIHNHYCKYNIKNGKSNNFISEDKEGNYTNDFIMHTEQNRNNDNNINNINTNTHTINNTNTNTINNSNFVSKYKNNHKIPNELEKLYKADYEKEEKVQHLTEITDVIYILINNS